MYTVQYLVYTVQYLVQHPVNRGDVLEDAKVRAAVQEEVPDLLREEVHIQLTLHLQVLATGVRLVLVLSPEMA